MNQYTVIDTQYEKRSHCCFVNGIPISVFELKQHQRNITIDAAYNQIKTYQEQVPSLFIYNSFNGS